MSKDEMRQTALLQAGLGMMAGTSPFFAVNVGQGGMAGLQAYQQAKAQNQALASEAYKSMMAARALGLDERRVAATEKAGEAERQHQSDMLKYYRDKMDKDVEIAMETAAGKNSGLKSSEVFDKTFTLFSTIMKDRDENPMSPYRGKSDGELYTMVEQMMRGIINSGAAATGERKILDAGKA
jgi:hypothetical protein